MRTEPLTVASLAGPVVVESRFLSEKYSIVVGGQLGKRTGRGNYVLPAAGGGTIDARLRGGLLNAYPTLEVNGVKHRTGPATPLALRILGLLPIALIGVGGIIGGLIGGVSVAVNMAITRLDKSTAVKTLLMIGVLAIAGIAWVLVAAALTAATGS